jgi:tetratricopeptide (TPR) repeat protein
MKITTFALPLCLFICACNAPATQTSKSEMAQPSVQSEPAQPQVDQATPATPSSEPAHEADHAGHEHAEGDGHDHAHDDDAPKVTYTAQQLIAMVTDARVKRNTGLIAQLAAFDQTVLRIHQVLADSNDIKTFDQLHKDLQADIESLKVDRYISTLAGTSKDFDIPLLAETQKDYVTQTDAILETYAKALAAAIRNDPDGHIGTWVKADLAHCIDVELMCQLNEFYWHHGNLDTPPGSFDSIIRISYRVLELEPTSASIYTDTAWLLWSRWVSWKQDPEKMPVGEDDDKTAIALMLRGRKACPDNASYHFDAAMTAWGLARYHKPEYWDFILDSLKLARKTVKPEEHWLNVRIRMTLGHVYRHLQRLDEARKAYESVFEVDPENAIAKRLLKEMDEAANTNNGQEI